ncbi:hypothetical protein COCMIDRAFT_40466 [Bipolaris oryzae ATCC 44560]|uniref:Uncharacterized protein n=1 Tax=Bipolaris oryzae ATCC 44560 TaxID=930090 RepID=W6YUY6_COCMI|nr:uncharacterized protein COCMIDRAFT_40466 [Bipolaris oryzae ATCC 44560]EUC41360.1 hypothetical protein COCMIDRAFT_40466 [Bipolaris oryzae ATCC 44560]
MSPDHVSAKALSAAKQHNRPGPTNPEPSTISTPQACSSHASWMAHRTYASSQHHGRTQAKQYNAPHRYPGQSSRPLQRPAAPWSSDYISEPVYSDSDDYINSQDPEPAPSPARYHERPSPMTSPYSPRERGSNSKPSYYTTPPRRRQQWPAQYQTPSPSSDYIAQSARTEDDYIATPASRMPGAFVDDDDDDKTPEYTSGYTQYRPNDSSPLQRSAPKSYAPESPPVRRRAAPKDYDNDPPRQHRRHRDSDLTSSNWDRKHDTARTRSRSRSRSRPKHLQPHELDNFHEARQFLERFRALDIKRPHPTSPYSSDEDRDDARSLRSRRSSVSRERPATYISSRRNSSNAKSKRLEAASDASVAWYRSSHRYKDDEYASSPEPGTGFSQPPRQSRLDRYERRPSYKLLTRDTAAQYSDADSLGRDPSTTRSYLSRPPSTTPSYISRSRSRSRAPSTAPSYVSPSPSPARTRARSPPSFSRTVTTTHRRSSSSSDNGIGEGSDYLPSDDDVEEDAARRHFSDDDKYQPRAVYSDDNGVGEGSDYVSSDEDEVVHRQGRYARGKMYSARERVREEDEEEEHSYSKGWGVGNRGEPTGGRRRWEGGVGI